MASAKYLLRRIAALFNEKDRTDGGKRMTSNGKVILTPLLSQVLLQNLPDSGGKAGEVSRLGDEHICAHFEAFFAVVQIIGGGEHHDGDIAVVMIVFDSTQAFKSVHVRHIKVEKNNGRRWRDFVQMINSFQPVISDTAVNLRVNFI